MHMIRNCPTLNDFTKKSLLLDQKGTCFSETSKSISEPDVRRRAQRAHYHYEIQAPDAFVTSDVSVQPLRKSGCAAGEIYHGLNQLYCATTQWLTTRQYKCNLAKG